MSHLQELVDLAGLTVIDVGAGSGEFAARLSGAGAQVMGIEIDTEKVTRARQAHGHVADFLVGRAEDLPVGTGTSDLICFIFSLHHVPAHQQGAGIEEALRCLRLGGRLHVAEPDVHGAMTEIVSHVDDETEVRMSTRRLLADIQADPRLNLLSKQDYTVTRIYDDFDSLLRTVVLTDPQRARRLPAALPAMRRSFDRRCERIQDGRYALEQPCTAWHFQANLT